MTRLDSVVRRLAPGTLFALVCTAGWCVLAQFDLIVAELSTLFIMATFVLGFAASARYTQVVSQNAALKAEIGSLVSAWLSAWVQADRERTPSAQVAHVLALVLRDVQRSVAMDQPWTLQNIPMDQELYRSLQDDSVPQRDQLLAALLRVKMECVWTPSRVSRFLTAGIWLFVATVPHIPALHLGWWAMLVMAGFAPLLLGVTCIEVWARADFVDQYGWPSSHANLSSARVPQLTDSIWSAICTAPTKDTASQFETKSDRAGQFATTVHVSHVPKTVARHEQ